MLWNNYDLEAFKEPAQIPNVKLFRSDQRNDFLVLYNEYSERNGVVHKRAYWLIENEGRVAQHHSPSFVKERLSQSLPSVPVSYSMPETNGQEFYAVYETNSQSVALFWDHGEMGSYNLPVYNDGRGRLEKIALTPFAVSIDITIIGGCVAIVWAYGLGGG